MFVPYPPYNCFDVERTNDRCVCGFSSLVTINNGENAGYCMECASKREKFVNDIIGDIAIGEVASLEYIILNGIEAMRKEFYKERFYYMVDSFFAKHQNEEIFIEPYEKAEFIVHVYYEKQNMAELVSNQLEMIIQTLEKNMELDNRKNKKRKNEVLKVYRNYKEKLESMRELDRNTISALNDVGIESDVTLGKK